MALVAAAVSAATAGAIVALERAIRSEKGQAAVATVKTKATQVKTNVQAKATEVKTNVQAKAAQVKTNVQAKAAEVKAKFAKAPAEAEAEAEAEDGNAGDAVEEAPAVEADEAHAAE